MGIPDSLLAAIIAFRIASIQTSLSSRTALGWASLTVQAAQKEKISPLLLSALVEVESSWQPDAEGPNGSIGLCQIYPSTARQIAKEKKDPPYLVELYDPEKNLEYGAYWLAKCIRETRTRYTALCLYHTGSKHRGGGFARKVLRIYRFLKQLR